MTWLWCLLSFVGGAYVGMLILALTLLPKIRHVEYLRDELDRVVEEGRAPVTIGTPWYEHPPGLTTRTRYH